MIDYTFSGVKVALTRKIKKSDLGMYVFKLKFTIRC